MCIFLGNEFIGIIGFSDLALCIFEVSEITKSKQEPETFWKLFANAMLLIDDENNTASSAEISTDEQRHLLGIFCVF